MDKLYFKTRVIFVKIIEDDPTYQEAILIGDTARESAWGPHNFIAVAVKNNDKWSIKEFQQISASYSCEDELHCNFTYYNIALNPKTPNHNVGAVITYAMYGASGHSFAITTIGWDRYEKAYYITTQQSSVPLVPDNKWH